MNKRLAFTWIGIGIGIAVAAASAARVQGDLEGLEVDVHNSEGWSLSGPVGGPTTNEERRAIARALASGGALPTGWSRTTSLGKVHAKLSGLSDPRTGKVQLIVEGKDESADMETSEIYVNGQLVSSASRANGQITDRSGYALLSQSAWIPPRLPVTVELKWYQADGDVRTQKHVVH